MSHNVQKVHIDYYEGTRQFQQCIAIVTVRIYYNDLGQRLTITINEIVKVRSSMLSFNKYFVTRKPNIPDKQRK